MPQYTPRFAEDDWDVLGELTDPDSDRLSGGHRRRMLKALR